MLTAFIIAGITTGSVYGLAGVGLVLTYKTSGIFNFAHGAVGTVAAFMFYTLHVQHKVAWPIAAVICVFGVGAVLGLMLERVGRAVSRSTLAVQVVATVGILLVIEATVTLKYGTAGNLTVPQFLPANSFTLTGAHVTATDVIVVIVGLAATAALWVYFRLTRTGIAMRAVVDDADLLDLAGTSPTRVRRWAWVIGSCFAATSGLLLAPLITLDGVTLTLLVVQAFGAAAVGRFKSLPLTYVGGIIIGVAASLATKYFTTGLLAKLPSALPFVVLFVVLLLARRTPGGDRAPLRPAYRSAWRAPWPVQAGGAIVVLAFLMFVPQFAGFHLQDWTVFLAMTMLFLSLGLVVRTSGQVSLAHVSFMAIGACGFSHLAVDQHWPWLAALLAAGLIAVPIGALLAIPAIRLSGLYLALSTLGFGIAVSYVFYAQPYMFGSLGLGLTAPLPTWGGLQNPRHFYYLVLGITVLVSAGVVALNRSRLGRLMRALADSPRGLSSSGASINVTRVLVFCLSAFLAAIAGALAGAAEGNITADSYQPLLSLTYFALVIIAVGGEPWYALLAAAGLTLIPSYFQSSANVTTYLQLLFGASALIYAVTPEDLRGVPAPVMTLVDRLRPSRGRRHQDIDDTDPRLGSVGVPAAPARALQLTDVHMQFGGLVAVQDMQLTATTGTITGLIGPNGAGKTTTFNVITGMTRPNRGTVMFAEHNWARLGPAQRAGRGVGRTFQRMELFDSLTVEQNVALGAEAHHAGSNPLGHLFAPRSQTHAVRAATAAAITVCDLGGIGRRRVGTLSTGQRRLVELARCLAGPFDLLLLDEPSSGLDRGETALLGSVLQQVVRERGIGVLLVEHDMTLVTAICDYVYVLDFGKQIFKGATRDVMASPIVRNAYLGSPALEDSTTSSPAGAIG